MTLNVNCQLGRKVIPLLPCGNPECPWFLYEVDYCNCFWVLVDVIERYPGFNGFTIKEISELLRLTEKETKDIIKNAIKHIRIRFRKQLINIE